MKKRMIIEILLIFLSIILIVNNCFLETLASSSGIVINPDDYRADYNNRAESADSLMNIGNDIIGFLQIIGSILSVVVLIVLGIKYMLGSVEERAEYKKTMWPYVLGAILVFSITNILGIIADITKSMF